VRFDKNEVSIIHECGLQRLIYEIRTHGESKWIPAYTLLEPYPIDIITHTTASSFQSSREFSYIQHMVQNHRARSKGTWDERPWSLVTSDETPDRNNGKYLSPDMDDLRSYNSVMYYRRATRSIFVSDPRDTFDNRNSWLTRKLIPSIHIHNTMRYNEDWLSVLVGVTKWPTHGESRFRS
jgi:hypothetical protein